MAWLVKTKNFLIIEGIILILNPVQNKIWPIFIKGGCPLPSPFPAFAPCVDQYILGSRLFLGGLFWTYIVFITIYKLIKFYKNVHQSKSKIS